MNCKGSHHHLSGPVDYYLPTDRWTLQWLHSFIPFAIARYEKSDKFQLFCSLVRVTDRAEHRITLPPFFSRGACCRLFCKGLILNQDFLFKFYLESKKKKKRKYHKGYSMFFLKSLSIWNEKKIYIYGFTNWKYCTCFVSVHIIQRFWCQWNLWDRLIYNTVNGYGLNQHRVKETLEQLGYRSEGMTRLK